MYTPTCLISIHVCLLVQVKMYMYMYIHVHVHELCADGFTTSVQCAVTDIAYITPLCMYMYISYYAFCLALVPGLPRCMHVLIMRRRQTFWVRPGTEATFCCSTVYIYSDGCAVHALYTYTVMGVYTYTVMGVLYMHCIHIQ